MPIYFSCLSKEETSGSLATKSKYQGIHMWKYANAPKDELPQLANKRVWVHLISAVRCNGLLTTAWFSVRQDIWSWIKEQKYREWERMIFLVHDSIRRTQNIFIDCSQKRVSQENNFYVKNNSICVSENVCS